MGKIVPSFTVLVLSIAVAYYLTQCAYPGKATLDNQRDQILQRYETFYEGAAEWESGQQPAHDEANNKDAVERYFTLITDFFEYGWGDAFHMAPMKPGWSFKRSMAFWEHEFAAVKLGINEKMKVADLGMGIGGPMRRIAEFTGADITGVTICGYQIERAKKITSDLSPWMQKRCHYLQGDYNNLPVEMEENSFDRAYFMESLSHAEDRAFPLAQAARIVKPGGLVGAWQWMLTPAFNYSDPVHMELKRGMEFGGGLRNLNKPHERHIEFERAGLEVLESYDMGTDAIERGWLGWWLAVTSGHDIPSMLTSSHFGRRLTMATVKVLETLGIAEAGTYKTAMMLEHCGYSSGISGEMGIFTPAWVTIGRVPVE